MRALRRRLRDEEGFGLLELLIAITILAIATSSLVGVFVSGHLALRRASQADAATVLADKLLERFRAEQFDDIALSRNLLGSADVTYFNDSNDPSGSPLQPPALPTSFNSSPDFGNITDADWSDAANAGASATACAVSADGPTVPVTCVPSRVIPDSNRSENAPDGRSYRIDTYVTWACANPATQALSGSVGSPTCSDGSGAVPLGAVKVVTIVVRDDTSPTTLAGNPLYRSSTVFDRLGGSVTCAGLPCGGGIPTATVTPTGTQSTSTQTTTAGSAPASPTSITLVNGGGTGSAYIDLGNVTALDFDVALGSTSLASDTITLTVTDGSTTIQRTLSGTLGSGVVHFTNINGQALAEGTITVTAVARNSSGTSSATGIQPTKDTSTPAAPTGITLTNGQGQSSNYVNISTKSSVGISVALGAASQTADTVSVTISDGSHSTNPVTTSGVAGGGTQAMPSINASSLNDGNVTASATVTSAAGNTSPAATVTFGKDTLAPTATITRAGASPTSAASVSWTVTFNDTVYNVAAGNFALVKAGLGGSPAITSVTGSGTTRTVTASTGTGSGTLGLNLTTAGSLVDKANNPITSLPFTGAVYTLDRTPPTITSVQLVNNGNAAGKIQKTDQVVIKFSKTMDTTSFCAGWDGSTISGSQVVITVNDGTASNDTLTVATTSGCSFHFGTIDLGSSAYVSGGSSTFSGSSGSNASSIAWNASTNTLTITLGTRSGGATAVVASSNAVYTADAAITDTAGNAVSGTKSTGLVTNF